jgi:hypothetical protein
VRMGKSAWRTPTPKFGPGVARLRGLLVFNLAEVAVGRALRPTLVTEIAVGWLTPAASLNEASYI